MKKLFTLCIPAFSTLVFFVSCNRDTKNNKSYSASIASTENQKTLPQSDLKFLYDAYALEHYNLQLATEAKYRSTATESLTLASSVIKEAEQLKDELSQVALQYNLTLPEDMSLEQKDYWKELVKQRGWSFDAKFADIIGYNLKYAHALYSQSDIEIKNEALKKIASHALSELQNQGDLALLQSEKIKEKTTEPKIKEDELASNNQKKKSITK